MRSGPGGKGGLYAVFRGWRLAPEGAAIHLRSRTAVIADVHLGYEWARASGGDMLPSHSRVETIERLSRLRGRFRFEQLVVAGDLVESAFEAQTHHDLAALRDWLRAQSVTLVWLRGNHDGPGSGHALECEVGGWTIAHGDRPTTARRLMIGHHHPSLRVAGLAAPCFLVGADRVVLPAFSPNAAGWNVAGGILPSGFPAGAPLRCVASTGQELLDFGPLDELPARLQQGAGPAGSSVSVSIPPGTGRSPARARPGRTQTGHGRS